MVKKTTLTIVILIIIIFSALNIQLFLGKGGISYAAISGYYVKEIPDLPLGLNLSIVAFVIQWIILLFIAIYTYSKFIQHKKAEQLKINFHLVRERVSKSSTDLDVLYSLLNEKKSLAIGSISKLFNIPKEKAVEWAKILENHGLAIVEYPAFSDPEVRINKKDEEKTKETREGERIEGKQKGKPPFKGGIPIPKAPKQKISRYEK